MVVWSSILYPSGIGPRTNRYVRQMVKDSLALGFSLVDEPYFSLRMSFLLLLL